VFLWLGRRDEAFIPQFLPLAMDMGPMIDLGAGSTSQSEGLVSFFVAEGLIDQRGRQKQSGASNMLRNSPRGNWPGGVIQNVMTGDYQGRGEL
jgi:hypothetical protein